MMPMTMILVVVVVVVHNRIHGYRGGGEGKAQYPYTNVYNCNIYTHMCVCRCA